MLHVEEFYGLTIDVPEDRRYDPDGEVWLQEVGDERLRVGLTHAGVVLSGGIEDLEPAVAVGEAVEENAVLFEVEAFKASQDVRAPVAGRVVAINARVVDDPELLDGACYGEAWLVEMEEVDRERLRGFPGAAEYVQRLRASEHCVDDGGGAAEEPVEGRPAGPGAAPGIDPGRTKDLVRDRYATLARTECACCGDEQAAAYVEDLYEPDELASLPEGVRRMAMGCGNPVALARLRPGMRVLDLGSGAGIDALLAAHKVGSEGRVVGVDMTREMVDKAQRFAAEAGIENVEFRVGDIEDLPVEDGWADAIISNCVINLSARKDRVFAEAFRVLAQGGILAVTDMVTMKPLPAVVRGNPAAWSSCVSGAVPLEKYLALIERAGFMKPRVEGLTEYTAEQIAAFKEVDEETFGPEGSLSPVDLEALEGALASARVITLKVGCC